MAAGRSFVALVTALSLSACATVNGVDTTSLGGQRGQTQAGLQDNSLGANEGAGFCARQPVICVLGGILVVGGVVALAAGSGGYGSSGGSGGSGGGGGY